MTLGPFAIKGLGEQDVEGLFDSPHLALIARNNIATIGFLTQRIKGIEREVICQVALQDAFKKLLTIPGIGIILGLTIMLEVGDINRFAKVGDYGSYCRCVRVQRLSNDKNKGEGNRKNGNKYLSWAYVEASHHAVRACPKANRFYQRKMAKTNGVVATKALSNKLARASYYVIRDHVAYDAQKLFG